MQVSVGQVHVKLKQGYSEDEAFLLTLKRLQDNKKILFRGGDQ